MFNYGHTKLPYDGMRNNHWVIRTPQQKFSVTVKQSPKNNQYSQGYVQINQRPMDMTDLKRIKTAVVTYGMLSSYLRLTGFELLG